MLVVEFDRTKFEGEIMPELERLKEAGIVRLLDLLFVRKPVGGELEVVQRSDLSEDEAIEFGALVGALVGLGTGDEEVSYRAAVAGAEELEDGHFFGDDGGLVPRRRDTRGRQRGRSRCIEHLWAIPLRDKLVAAGGATLADEWIHPKDLLAVGALAAERTAASS